MLSIPNNVHSVVVSLWAYLYPLAFTNMGLNLLYPLRSWWPFFAKLDAPVDGGIRFFDGKPLLGRSTTWPGLVFAVLIGALFHYVFGSLFGFYEALLAYGGHAVGSFVKRRLSIADGSFLPVVDHGDYVILCGAVFFFFGLAPLWVVATTVLLTLCLQPLITYCGHKLGLRKYPL